MTERIGRPRTRKPGKKLLSKYNLEMSSVFCTFLLVLITGYNLVSCSRSIGPIKNAEFYFFDRPAHSYSAFVESFSQEEPATLILLDYHHNAGPGPTIDAKGEIEGSLASYNWIGGLIQTGLIREVLWVSGRNLLLPNREARKNWLERHIVQDSLTDADQKRRAIRIMDWPELLNLTSIGFSHPVGVALDLSVLVVDPGHSPTEFLGEILDYIDRLNPSIVTLSLSSTYQPDAELAWNWYARSIERLAADREGIFVAGTSSWAPESVEEAEWLLDWSSTQRFTDYGAAFAPGLEQWDNAPQSVWNAIMHASPTAGDATAERLLATLAEAHFGQNLLSDLARAQNLTGLADEVRNVVTSALDDGSSKDTPRVNLLTKGRYGFGVRFARHFEELGCYFLYDSVEDFGSVVALVTREAAFHDPRYRALRHEDLSSIDVEVSILGTMVRMDQPEDFIPGFDSILVESSIQGVPNRTLLQASIAVERNLSRIQFLETVMRKAGLPFDSWEDKNLVFYKASTLSLRSPFQLGR